MNHPRAAVIGLAGARLTPEEADLLQQTSPLGVILFRRNIETPDQLGGLIDEMQTAAGWSMPIWVDQEGGRVQRLTPPDWQDFPPMRAFGRLYEREPDKAADLLATATLMLGQMLKQQGFGVDCHPVVDLFCPEADAVIGDRAFSADPATVTACAKIVVRNLCHAGIVPVLKHFPGHGRADVDSHCALPRVAVGVETLHQQDLAPYRVLMDAPMVMTAHIVYPDWDGLPATLSPKILGFLRTELGYRGLVVSDDLAMGALSAYGDVPSVATRCLAAGCDLVLYCAGDFDTNRRLLAEMPGLSSEAEAAWQKCQTVLAAQPMDVNSDQMAAYHDWRAGVVA